MGFFIQIWLLTNSDSGRRVDPGLGFQYCHCALVPLTAIADINNLSHSGYIISQYRDVTVYCCFTSYLHIQTNDFFCRINIKWMDFQYGKWKKSQEVESECSANDQSGCSTAPLSAIFQMLDTGVVVYAILLTFCGNSLTQMLSSFPLVKIATLIRYQLSWVACSQCYVLFSYLQYKYSIASRNLSKLI